MALHYYLCYTYPYDWGHTTSLRSAISEEERIMDTLVFVDDTDLPVEGKSNSEVQEKLQVSALTWAGEIIAT